MPRFAANLSLLFTEMDFLQRYAAAAQAGFDAVECQFPYAWPLEQHVEELQRHRLSLVLHNLPAGDWSTGERGIACLPGREEEFQESVGQAIEYARALGCRQLNCLAGLAPAEADPDELFETFTDNLRFAAAALEAEGMNLLIEPINQYDIPGFYLHTTTQALDVMDEVGADNLYLQYDVYHAQRSEGELAATFARLQPNIAHVQIADNPGRHEPGSGEINYPFLFRELDRLGYDGWIGCEYIPAAGTVAGLGWLTQARTAG